VTLSPPFATLADRAAAARFFAERPAAKATFDGLAAHMAALGPMELASTKSRVAFTAGTRFLWVHQANLDGSLTVGFLLPGRLDSPRLRSGQAGGRWSHHVRMSRLDAELEHWFAAAYAWDRRAIRATPPSRPRRRPAAGKAGAERRRVHPRATRR
jgi:hypothetical protein